MAINLEQILVIEISDSSSEYCLCFLSEISFLKFKDSSMISSGQVWRMNWRSRAWERIKFDNNVHNWSNVQMFFFWSHFLYEVTKLCMLMKVYLWYGWPTVTGTLCSYTWQTDWHNLKTEFSRDFLLYSLDKSSFLMEFRYSSRSYLVVVLSLINDWAMVWEKS